MRLLIPDDHNKDRLREVVEYATEHPYSVEDFNEMKSGLRSPPELIDEFCCLIPVGYKVVYIHWYSPRGILFRQLNLSVDEGEEDLDVLPGPESLKLVMEFMGFETPFQNAIIYKSRTVTGHACVHVTEVI